MKTFVINLDSATERMQHMVNELSKVGLPFERMPAVDVKRVPVVDGLRPAEVSCYLSHVACWKRFLETDEEHCLILEDDAVFAPSAKEILSDLSWWVPGVDLVKIETADREGIPIKVGIDRRYTVTATHDLRELKGSHYGTAAYILSRDGAALALEYFSEPISQVDQVMFSAPEKSPLRYQQMIPAPVYQLSVNAGNVPEVFVSSITPERADYSSQKSNKKKVWHQFLYLRDQLRRRLGLAQHERRFVRFG